MSHIGLNLTGGGARGAYQAGSLLALSEIIKKNKLIEDEKVNFKYLAGVSAGAINIAYLASRAHNFSDGMKELSEIWSNLKPAHVYRTDFMSVGRNVAKWMGDLSLGTMIKSKNAKFLLETSPLRKLLEKNISFSNIKQNYENGLFYGLACTAYSYFDQKNITFLNAPKEIHWERPRRLSQNVEFNADHIMASCAIPLLFPAVKVGGQYMGDGTFRSSTPISPLIHMGAQKILIIGVRGPNEYQVQHDPAEPGISKIFGLMLNALFFDTLDMDIERIMHINEIVEAQRGSIRTDRSHYSKIDLKVLRPSQDVSKLAMGSTTAALPKTIKFLLSGLGDAEDTNELASYILFDSHFTKQLIEMGYEDVRAREAELIEWLAN